MTPRTRHRGSIYILVLGVAMIITVIGFSALVLGRINTRIASQANDWLEAGNLAVSAVELAQTAIRNDPGWRTHFHNRQPSEPVEFGRGTLSWELVDSADNSLNDNVDAAVRLYGIGRVGDTTRVYSVLMIPSGRGLDVLKPALYSDQSIYIGSTLTVRDGTINAANGVVSTNGDLNFGGNSTLNGDVEADDVNPAYLLGLIQTSTLNGTILPYYPKSMPSPAVWDAYLAKATFIPWSSFDPGNSGIFQPGLMYYRGCEGYSNPDALYCVKIPSNITSASIRNSRIVGTLLVLGSSNQTLTIEGSVNWQTGRPDYPSLIVNGCGKVIFNLNGSQLSEASVGQNLNPPFLYPYQGPGTFGTFDSDTTDLYPCQLNGLFHLMNVGSVYLYPNLNLTGAIVTNAPVQVSGNVTLTADPNLYAAPPIGYTQGNSMIPLPGTWRWDSLP